MLDGTEPAQSTRRDSESLPSRAGHVGVGSSHFDIGQFPKLRVDNPSRPLADEQTTVTVAYDKRNVPAASLRLPTREVWQVVDAPLAMGEALVR